MSLLISHALISSLLPCSLQREDSGAGGQQGLLSLFERGAAADLGGAVPGGKGISSEEQSAAVGAGARSAGSRAGNGAASPGRQGGCLRLSEQEGLPLPLRRAGGTKHSILMALLHPSAPFTPSQ